MDSMPQNITQTQQAKSPLFYYLMRILIATPLAFFALFISFLSYNFSISMPISFGVYIIVSLLFDLLTHSILGLKESNLIFQEELTQLGGTTLDQIDLYRASTISIRRHSTLWSFFIASILFLVTKDFSFSGKILIATYILITGIQLFYLYHERNVSFPYPIDRSPNNNPLVPNSYNLYHNPASPIRVGGLLDPFRKTD